MHDVSNYSDWEHRMEDYLFCKDLYDLVVGDKAKPEGMRNEKWSNMQRETLGNTRRISQSIFQHILKKTEVNTLGPI